MNDLFGSGFFPYAHRCTYINSMRKPFEAKMLHAQEAVRDVRDDVRETGQAIGRAAHSQAQLNIALTGVCLAALLIAALLVRSQRTGSGVIL